VATLREAAVSDSSAGLAWAGYVAVLAFIAIGGGFSALLPELQRIAVEAHGWVTGEQFSAGFALAQAAPGPNVIFVPLIGWQIGGWLGAVAATFAVVAPSVAVTLPLVGRGYKPEANGRVGKAIADGLQPFAIGLTLASGWVLSRSADIDWSGSVLMVATVAILLRWRINPAWMILVGGALGAVGLV
jgi:chromate transporter